MNKIYFSFSFLIISLLFACQQQKSINQADHSLNRSIHHDTAAIPVVKMETNNVVLMVNLNGGAFFDFHLKDLPVNPINWRMKDTINPPFMGHFLCFDRWGPPTPAEEANGFHHHGEASTEPWKMLAEPLSQNGKITCSMMCTLPMGGLQLKRKIELSENEPVFFVTEEIKNLNKYGRMFNIVQHVSIAPPFLDTTTLLDNNTIKGFQGKEDGSLNQEEPVLNWPVAIHDGETVNFRQFKNKWPRVSTFLYDQNDEYGWVTACNAKENIMLGYIWKTADYPWINFWRAMENGIPVAYGMEFGTTGLHETFPIVAKKGKIFNQNIYDFIDADQVISKSFTAFLAKIPDDYKGVKKIEINNSLLTIKENNKVSRDIVYHIN
jgi:hypothetical protein